MMIQFFHLPMYGLHAVLSAIVSWTVLTSLASYLRRRKMPPGPPGIPLLGNALQVPVSMPWFRFTEWKETYGEYHAVSILLVKLQIRIGPMFSLNMAGQPVVVLNTHKATSDLFGEQLQKLLLNRFFIFLFRSSFSHIQRPPAFHHGKRNTNWWGFYDLYQVRRSVRVFPINSSFCNA